MAFYSQNGEDVVLHEIFRNKADGFFVEIGCIDGRRFSNTLMLEERGWKGLCIEAHAGFIELLKKNRPNSIIEHCAAGERDEGPVTFYANARGSLSTLDPSLEESFRAEYGAYFTGFEEQTVPKLTLDTIFQKHGISNIDCLSLDIEGYEVEALKGLDLDRYRPKVLIVESDEPEHEAEVDRRVLPHGYTKSVRLAGNVFYLTDGKMAKALSRMSVLATLVHTEHPLDETGDQEHEVALSFRSGLVERLLARLFG